MNQQQLEAYAHTIGALHDKFKPHSGQIKVGRALFNDDIRKIFVGCGRKWGKTEIIMYILYRWASMFPGSVCYYFAPFRKQARKIIWENQRIQNFLSSDAKEKLLAKRKDGTFDMNGDNMAIRLKNDSLIVLDGSDNYEAHRGTEPHICVYEEMKDFRPEFHIAMEPNLAVYNSPLIIIGTPPDRDCQYTELWNDWSKRDDAFCISEPSWNNPHIDKAWLESKKEELIGRGEWDVWEREYGARYVKGGANKIFPMIKESFLQPHKKVMREVQRDIKRMKKYWWADPAGASVFAVNFVFINPYNKKVYLLDEIYEARQSHMTVKYVGGEALKKRNELWTPRDEWDWTEGYDEAATWFANEMRDNFGIQMIPSQKHAKSKEEGLSLIKDIMRYGLLTVSDRCEKTFWELDNYMKDGKTGKIPKENDHTIDNIRYILVEEMYDLTEYPLPKKESEREDFRGAKISDDFPQLDDFGRMNEDIMINDVLKDAW